jgi:hypothetical protein
MLNAMSPPMMPDHLPKPSPNALWINKRQGMDRQMIEPS